MPYTGSDAAAFISSAANGATIELSACTHAWSSEVTCTGKGATVLDAGRAGLRPVVL